MDLNVFCPTCGKGFEAKYKLNDHIKNVHDENEYPCEDCSKIFTGKRKLLNHKESHKKFNAQNARATFLKILELVTNVVKKNIFVQHVITAHSPLLKTHIESIHPGV